MEKVVPFGLPLWDMRARRCKPHRAARGRDEARGQGAQGQARVRGWLQLQRGSRGPQMRQEKLWMPWNGLVVIGRRMELLDRNTSKPRMWDLKLEPEYWGLADVEKTVLKEKAGLSQEKVDVKLLHSAASALQASAGLEKDDPKEVGKQEFSRKIGAESESGKTVTGSRRESGFKKRLSFTGAETTGEDLRSRAYKPEQNEKELRSSGEKLRSSREKQRSNGKKLVFRGEKQGPRGEKLETSEGGLRSPGHKLQSSAEKLGSSREKLETSGDKLRGSGMGSTNEEKIERVVEVTDAEMKIPFERVEGNAQELKGNEEVIEAEDVLDGVNITDESVPMEEKEVIDEEDTVE